MYERLVTDEPLHVKARKEIKNLTLCNDDIINTPPLHPRRPLGPPALVIWPRALISSWDELVYCPGSAPILRAFLVSALGAPEIYDKM